MVKKPIKIIMVDDDKAFLLQTRDKLLKLNDNFKIHTFTSAKKAIERAIKEEFHVFVSDYQMPEMDGLVLLKQLRKKGINIPFIILTAEREEEIAIKAINLGADRYLRKNTECELIAKEIEAIAKSSAEKRNTLEALKESERVLSTLLSNLMGMAYRCKNEKNWTMKFVSQGCYELTGYLPEDLLNNNKLAYFELIHPDDVSYVEGEVEKALRENESFKLTYRIFTKDGEEKWVWEQGQVLTSKNGSTDLIEGFITDVTKTKKAQVELRNSEKNYRNLVERANDGIAVVQDSVLKYVNPKLMDMLGYTEEKEILNTPFAIYIAPEELPKVSRNYKIRMAGKEAPEIYETIILDKSHKKLDVELNASIIQYDGKSADFVFVRDISQRKKAENAIRRSKKTYESIYETMLSILAERDLPSVIKKIADEATELLEASGSTVYLGDTKNKVLTPIYSNHISYNEEIMSYEIPFGKGISGNVYKSGKTIYINYDQEDPYSIHIPGTDQTEDKYESVISVPLLHNHQVIGVLTINKLKENFDESDVNRLNIFAKQAELALKRADTLDKLIESRQALMESEIKVKKLHEVAKKMINVADEKELYTITMEAAKNILDFSVCSIDMLDLFEFEVKATIGGVQKEGTRYSIEGVAEKTIHQGSSFIIKDLNKISFAVPKRPSYRSAISIPIGDNGVFQALSEEVNYFDEKDLELAEILISHFTVAYERLVTQRDLNEEREQLLSIFDSIDEIIYVSDLETYEILYANKAAHRLFDYRLIGELCYEQLQDRDEPCDFCTNDIILKNKGEPYTWEYHNPIIDRHLMIVDRVIKWTDGRDVRFEIAIDITERKKAEKKLEKYKDHLEELVKERTEELNEVNQELDSFAYSVSHDLRAPLRGIEGFSQALLEDCKQDVNETALGYANRISEAANRMNILIQDLLSYSRMTTNEMNLRSISTEEILERVLEEMKDIIEENDADIVIDKPIPDVVAHSSTLVQILTNFISNSIKYVSSDSNPQIKIRGKSDDQYVRISIEDNGIGIPADKYEEVFEIFERLHGRETYPGTGIGLAIIKKGVERMGGRVGVESELGKGSTFWIELPSG